LFYSWFLWRVVWLNADQCDCKFYGYLAAAATHKTKCCLFTAPISDKEVLSVP
jgi:hypothetical protein